MKYANTIIFDGQESVLVVLPLESVPGFDPEAPPPGVYVVEDDVAPGWRRDPSGRFVPPPPPPPPSPADLCAEYELALDKHLDAVAQRFRYRDRTRLALRAGYPNTFRALGLAYGEWMDGCNDLAKALLADVLAERKPLPSVEDFLAALPAFVPPPGYVAEA